MTVKTFFNKGVYISNLKRFWVGSLLYFLFSFVTTNSIISAYDIAYDKFDVEYLLSATSGFAIVVPTIVAVLVYKFVHSKKNAIFAHSLPVTRTQNYFSTLLSALTLMWVPVILNGVVIFFLTMEWSIALKWIGYNLLILFVLFAFSSFVAMLTGSTAVVFVLNIGIHLIFPAISTCYNFLMETFALGFSSYASPRADVLTFISAPTVLTELVYLEKAKHVIIVSAILIVVALLLYGAAFVLYKKRNLENCEDVAPFKVLNPIFKYIATTTVLFISMSIFVWVFNDEPISSVFTILLMTAIAYFGSEMILKKKVKVWGAYNGFVVYVLVFAAFFAFMAFTSIFGFETYVPKAEDIASAKIQDWGYSNSNGEFSNAESIKLLQSVHKELIKANEHELINNRNYRDFAIEYNLKNGKTVARSYDVTSEKLFEIMGKFYENEEFKREYEPLFDIKDADIEAVWADITVPEEKYFTNAERKELLECIKKDILKNGYAELYNEQEMFMINIKYIQTDENGEQLFDGEGFFRYAHKYVAVNKNYEETIKWMTDKGYLSVSE